MMKSSIRSLALIAGLVLACSAQAQLANEVVVQQMNAAGDNTVTRYMTNPADGADGIAIYNGTTERPAYVTLGTGLSITSGVLSASTGATQVNSDWSAVSGVSAILNKPALFSGSYADLTGKPTIPAAQVPVDWSAATGVAAILNKPLLSGVATTGAYADLTGKPNLATVATSGSYNDLVDKPTIPTAPAARMFSAPARALDTCYQASATRDVLAHYGVDVTSALVLTVGAKGSAYLTSYSNSACTAGAQPLAAGQFGNITGLSVSIGATFLSTINLSAVIPAGRYVKITAVQDVGTQTMAIRAEQQEVSL